MRHLRPKLRGHPSYTTVQIRWRLGVALAALLSATCLGGTQAEALQPAAIFDCHFNVDCDSVESCAVLPLTQINDCLDHGECGLQIGFEVLPGSNSPLVHSHGGYFAQDGDTVMMIEGFSVDLAHDPVVTFHAMRPHGLAEIATILDNGSAAYSRHMALNGEILHRQYPGHCEIENWYEH